MRLSSTRRCLNTHSFSVFIAKDYLRELRVALGQRLECLSDMAASTGAVQLRLKDRFMGLPVLVAAEAAEGGGKAHAAAGLAGLRAVRAVLLVAVLALALRRPSGEVKVLAAR